MKKYISGIIVGLFLLVGCSSASLIKENEEGLKAPSFFEIMNSDKFSLTIDPTYDQEEIDKVYVTTNADGKRKSLSLKTFENTMTVIEDHETTYVLLHENKMGYASDTDKTDPFDIKDFDYQDYQFIEKGLTEDKNEFETYQLGNDTATFYFNNNQILGFSVIDFKQSKISIKQYSNITMDYLTPNQAESKYMRLNKKSIRE